MDTFSTPQVAERFDVSEQTVKNWTKEFAEYLSPTAAPEKGKTRAFTSEDVAVLAVVHELVGRGKNTDAAHVALRAGQRGADSALTIRNDRDMLIATQRERDMLQGAVMELRSLLESERTNAREELQRRDERILDLERRLARAELRLELIDAGELKPPAKD